MNKFTIMGGGAFGAALAIAMSDRPVHLWMRDFGDAARTRIAPRLPNHQLPDTITLVPDIPSDGTVLLAVPTQSLGTVLKASPQLAGSTLVACCKGIDLCTGLGPTGLINSIFPTATVGVLTGPSFASEIAAGLPTALTLACSDATVGEALQHQLSAPKLRLYLSDDTKGAELGGALKNVIAIACGAAIGAGYGDSARAAIMTRGFGEMVALGSVLGAQTKTFSGLSGLGDLSLTCMSPASRNFRFGVSLGTQTAFSEQTTVEGAVTATAAANLARDHGLDLPVFSTTASLVAGTISAAQALTDLISRPLRKE